MTKISKSSTNQLKLEKIMFQFLVFSLQLKSGEKKKASVSSKERQKQGIKGCYFQKFPQRFARKTVKSCCLSSLCSKFVLFMCANGGEVKLGEDPQPPAVTNQGATLFLKEDLKDLTPVICQNHFFVLVSDSRPAALHHLCFQSNLQPPAQTAASSQ